MATKASETGLGPSLWATIIGLACVCCLLLVWLGLQAARTLAEAEDLHQKQDGLHGMRILDERPKQPGGIKW